jgi:hypothetical protein
MSRKRLSPFVGAVALCLVVTALHARPEPDDQSRLQSVLQVQKALEQGSERLQRGDFRAAVEVLESRVHLIDGQRKYLDTLREAYIGYIAELKKDGRTVEVARYQERLEAIDPGARLTARGTQTSLPPPPTALLAAATGGPRASTPASGAAGKPTPAASPGFVGRGKIEEPDPFSDENSLQHQQARDALSRAAEEFRNKHYPEAAKLYDQADRIDHKSSTTADHEAWAYCKLFVVNDTLNRPDGAAAPELEKEVRLALSLAPKLDGVGADLLRRIQNRSSSGSAKTLEAATVEVKHTPRQSGQNYAVAETANFRIFHNQKPEFAERVARAAEAARATATRKWFGEETGAWNPRCDLYLHATAADYNQATGVPPSSPGHSTMRSEGERVLERRIDLHCDDPNMSIGVLPHETTHVVLAGRFGRHVVPRWADEGMAVLSEPRDRIERHLRNLPMHSRNQQIFGSSELMSMPDYPKDHALIGAFYAQSVSLVEYLSSRKDPKTFARFLREGLDGGYEAALKKHYGIADFRELDAQWRQYALNGGGNASVVAGKMR